MSIPQGFSTKKVLQKARQWMGDISNSLNNSEYLQDIILCIIGIYLSDLLENKNNRHPSKRTLKLLSHQLENCNIDLAKEKIGAVKLLLCLKILRLYGLEPGILSEISKDYANLLNKIVFTIPMEYTAIQMFLHDMKLIDTKPQTRMINSKDIYDEPLEILLGSKEKLNEICEFINAATLYGTASVSSDPESLAEMIRLMIPVMFQRFRSNDLETGLVLLRSLNYLGLKDKKILDMALGFLKGQQRADGSFGYQPQGSKFFSKTKFLSRSLYLSNTVSCVWSIAEIVIVGFRLFALFKEKRKKG